MELNLFTHGVQTVKVYDPELLPQVRKCVDAAILEFPYFRSTAPAYSFGSFQALGDPGSAWHPTLRRLRMIVHYSVKSLLAQHVKTSGLYTNQPKFSSVMDRLMIRPAGVQIDGEAWHRDIGSTQHLPKGGTLEFFGGFINLDDTPQRFRCIPGSHKDHEGKLIDVRTQEDGFSRIPVEYHAYCETQAQTIEVPPENVVIFYQHIAHTIVKNLNEDIMYRLFTGFMISDSPEWKEFIFGGEAGLLQMATTQSIGILPGGTKWPIYYGSHNFYKNRPFRLLPDTPKKWKSDPTKKLRQLTPGTLKENFLQIFTDEYVSAFGVTQYMPSMQEIATKLGVPLFEQVYNDEVDIFRPHIVEEDENKVAKDDVAS